MFILLYSNSLQQAVHGNLRYLVAAVFVVLLYASVLVHELSHCVVALAFGLPVRRVLLYPLGGFSEIEKEAPTPAREFLVAAAGPAISLVLAAVGYGLSKLVPYGTAHVLVTQLMWANLLVGLFNLLPGLPLDGGRMLRAGIWKISHRPGAATIGAAWTGRVIAAALLIVPFALFARDSNTNQIFDAAWLAVIAAFMWLGRRPGDQGHQGPREAAQAAGTAARPAGDPDLRQPAAGRGDQARGRGTGPGARRGSTTRTSRSRS